MTRFLSLAVLLFAMPLAAAEPEINNVVIPSGPSPQIVVPVAGSLPGANGTFYRSDIVIDNWKATPQRVRLTWLPQAGSGQSISTTDITVGVGIGSDDFVAEVIGRTGIGSIIVTGITDAGTNDPTARLYVTSRIWTPEPDGGKGTYSQSLSTLPTSAINSSRLTIPGMRADEQYRLNIGVVNLDPTREQAFVITFAGRTPATTPQQARFTLPPGSMRQIPLVGASGPLRIEVTTEGTNPTPLWVAYGANVDNVTGDGWAVLGFATPVVTTTN